MPTAIKHTPGAYNGPLVANKSYLIMKQHEKVVLVYGIPVISILTTAIYLRIKQWNMALEPGNTIIEAKFKILL